MTSDDTSLAEPAVAPVMASRLLVAISAADPVARLRLEALVRAAGHVVAPSSADAAVVIADSLDQAYADDPPTLVLTATAAADEAAPSGLLGPDATPAQIDAALRAIAVGLIVRLPDGPASGFAPTSEGAAATLLTPRELEILAAVGEGLSNKAAARRLNISAHTVKFHLEAIFAKLTVTTRTEAVAKGLRRGILRL